MSLQDLQKKIKKASKGTHVSIFSDSDITAIDNWVPTPSYDLNRILSGSLFKGLPEKSLSTFCGQEASFKSSCAALVAADAQKKGYTPLIIDTEGAWTNDFVERWGLNPDEMLYIYDPFVDNISVILGQILDSEEEKFVIIVDSVGGLESRKLVDDAVKGDVKQDQGQLAKRIKRMVKLLLNIVKTKNSIGIMCAHMYGNTNAGLFGPSEVIGGGKAVLYSSHIILQLNKSKKYDKEKKNVIGTIVKANTLKNRFYPAFNKCEVDIDFKNGINRYHGMVPLAAEFGFIEKGGAGWYTNKLTGEKVQGEIKAEELIDDDMLNKINTEIEKTGFSTIDEELKHEFTESDFG